MRAITAVMEKRTSSMVSTQKLVQLLLCAQINVSTSAKVTDAMADRVEDVSLVVGLDEFEVVGRFFDGFAVGRPRSDQSDLEEIVTKELKDLNGLMKESI